MIKNATATIKWTDIVAAVVVIYSAFLSTFNLVRDINRNRYRAKITCGYKFEISEYENKYIYVKLSNTGEKNIVVIESGFFVRGINGRLPIFNEEVKLPTTIESGNCFETSTRLNNIRKIVVSFGFKKKVRMRPYCIDAIGNIYKGKRIDLTNDIL